MKNVQFEETSNTRHENDKKHGKVAKAKNCKVTVLATEKRW